MKQIAAAAALAVTLGGCSVYREATAARIDATANWRQVATDRGRTSLRNWRQAWEDALPEARAVGAAALDADPVLFDPDRALADPLPPAGKYRCRTYKLGKGGTAVSGFIAYPWQECVLTEEGATRRLQKLTGSQRPTGLIFPDTSARAIFLGVLVLGDESAPLRYGLDADRDMIGYVEHIEPRRWRLVMPYPRFESKLDVIELASAS
jgi:hypothetical protein